MTALDKVLDAADADACLMTEIGLVADARAELATLRLRLSMAQELNQRFGEAVTARLVPAALSGEVIERYEVRK